MILSAFQVYNKPTRAGNIGWANSTKKGPHYFVKPAHFSSLNEAFCFAGRYFAKTFSMGLLLCCHTSLQVWRYCANIGTAHLPNDTQPRHAFIYPFSNSSTMSKNKHVKRYEFISLALPSELLLLTLSGI